MTLNISLQPEYVAAIGSFGITNSLVTSLAVTSLVVVGVMVAGARKNRKSFVVRAMRYFLFELLKLSEMVVGNRKRAMVVIPLVATFFIFIVLANLLALVPGFLGSFYVTTAAQRVPLLRSPNSDLNTTLALALVSVAAAQYFSLKQLGAKLYLRRFINLSGPLRFFMGFFEIISESVKVLSFSFRLFGNIFAGEVLLLVIAFLAPYIVPVPFMILEVFVGVIQAFIFSMLTLSFIRTASIRQ